MCVFVPCTAIFSKFINVLSLECTLLVPWWAKWRFILPRNVLRTTTLSLYNTAPDYTVNLSLWSQYGSYFGGIVLFVEENPCFIRLGSSRRSSSSTDSVFIISQVTADTFLTSSTTLRELSGTYSGHENTLVCVIWYWMGKLEGWS